MINLSLHHTQDDSEQNTTFIQAIYCKLEKRRADFFQDYPNAIRFNLVHLCPSMLFFSFAEFLLCCSTILNKWLLLSFDLLSGRSG